MTSTSLVSFLSLVHFIFIILSTFRPVTTPSHSQSAGFVFTNIYDSSPSPPNVSFLRPIPIPQPSSGLLSSSIPRSATSSSSNPYHPPRAYFALVSFAILDVSINSMNTKDGSAIGILGRRSVSECLVE